jgi:hypothetical protein
MLQCNIAVFKKINWGVSTNIYKNVPKIERLKSEKHRPQQKAAIQGWTAALVRGDEGRDELTETLQRV